MIQKAKKVIETSQTCDQLETAIRYANLAIQKVKNQKTKKLSAQIIFNLISDQQHL